MPADLTGVTTVSELERHIECKFWHSKTVTKAQLQHYENFIKFTFGQLTRSNHAATFCNYTLGFA
jgi:hypothetical protein